MSCPSIPKDLLEYLQRAFPNKLPEHVPHPSDFGILVGQRRVIAHLEVQFERQNRTALLGPT